MKTRSLKCPCKHDGFFADKDSQNCSSKGESKTPTIAEILDKISAEILRMDYHTIDCDVLVDQEEVLYIIEQYKKGELT